MEFQSLVSFQGWTFIAQILNLFIQILLFKKFLFKPIKNILAKRQQEVDAIYDDANASRLEAENARAEYSEHLQNAQEEAAAITARAAAAAQSRSDELIESAKKEAFAIRDKAESDIALERKKAVNEMKDEISDLAVEIASKIAQKEIDKSSHEALIEKFIDDLGETK